MIGSEPVLCYDCTEGHFPAVWRSWAANGNVAHSSSLSHAFAMSTGSPVVTPSSGSAMSSQLSLNSVDIGPARRSSCDAHGHLDEHVSLGTPPAVAMETHKRRFERTNSAPNQAALFARLRQSAPVNLATTFAMSATIREQPSLDQDDVNVDVADVSQLNVSLGRSAGTLESENDLDSLCMRMTEAALDG